MRSTKLAIKLSALALGTAMTVMPALAQEYHNGRAANDGGPLKTQDQNAQNQGQNSGSRANTSVAQNSTPSQERNYQDNARSRSQENLSDNDRQGMSRNMDRNMASDTGQTRPRMTRRMTMIRRMRRPTADTETTARGENTEYLRSAAGPTNVAVNAAPPQRQYSGANGPAGGFGDRYYDRASENYGDEGFAPRAGFGPERGFGATAAMNENDIAACQMRFQSFDPASGTYLGYDGLRHPCP